MMFSVVKIGAESLQDKLHEREIIYGVSKGSWLEQGCKWYKPGAVFARGTDENFHETKEPVGKSSRDEHISKWSFAGSCEQFRGDWSKLTMWPSTVILSAFMQLKLNILQVHIA